MSSRTRSAYINREEKLKLAALLILETLSIHAQGADGPLGTTYEDIINENLVRTAIDIRELTPATTFINRVEDESLVRTSGGMTPRFAITEEGLTYFEKHKKSIDKLKHKIATDEPHKIPGGEHHVTLASARGVISSYLHKLPEFEGAADTRIDKVSTRLSERILHQKAAKGRGRGL